MKYQLIIFDCDGTLVDTEPVTNRLISQMMGELGIAMTTEECVEEFAGKNVMAITSFIRNEIGDFDVIAFEKDYRTRCMKVFGNGLEIIPGVESILQRVVSPKCVASNGPQNKMRATLGGTGLLRYFEEQHIFSAYDIQKWKPAPDLFLFAADQMKVPSERSLVIEDTLSGVQGALNAGIDVLAYNPEAEKELWIDGVPNFRTMSEIADHLTECGMMVAD